MPSALWRFGLDPCRPIHYFILFPHHDPGLHLFADGDAPPIHHLDQGNKGRLFFKSTKGISIDRWAIQDRTSSKIIYDTIGGGAPEKGGSFTGNVALEGVGPVGKEGAAGPAGTKAPAKKATATQFVW